MTVREAAEAMRPPIPRRELARRLKGVQPVGQVAGRLGRRPALYPLAAIMRAHTDWVREHSDVPWLAKDDPSCQNGPQAHPARSQDG